MEHTPQNRVDKTSLPEINMFMLCIIPIKGLDTRRRDISRAGAIIEPRNRHGRLETFGVTLLPARTNRYPLIYYIEAFWVQLHRLNKLEPESSRSEAFPPFFPTYHFCCLGEGAESCSNHDQILKTLHENWVLENGFGWETGTQAVYQSIINPMLPCDRMFQEKVSGTKRPW